MNEPDWLLATRTGRFPWANDAQWECLRMLADLTRGFHHLFGKIRASNDNGIQCELECHNYLGTFDYNELTRLVVMAHDRAIRAEIRPCGTKRLSIYLHKRSREGTETQRHPTLEDAVTKIRKELEG